jgi:hypothetical protein
MMKGIIVQVGSNSRLAMKWRFVKAAERESCSQSIFNSHHANLALLVSHRINVAGLQTLADTLAYCRIFFSSIFFLALHKPTVTRQKAYSG